MIFQGRYYWGQGLIILLKQKKIEATFYLVLNAFRKHFLWYLYFLYFFLLFSVHVCYLVYIYVS